MVACGWISSRKSHNSINRYYLKYMNKTLEYLLKFKSLAALLIVIAVTPPSAFGAEAQMPEVVVSAKSEKAVRPVVSKRLKTSDTATLLSDEPSVSLQTGGGVSSLPVVNGLADERLLICVDCMQITSACANHMNPPLSYIPPSSVGRISVNAGVSPVSFGGDNIGGTIFVESEPPVFAEKGSGTVETGSLSSYYRSNNHARGVSVRSSIANSNLSFGVTASHDRADDYTDGHGNRVTSTYYESNNLGLTLAAKTDSGVLTVKAGHQSIPDQGFVNQWMDMVDNDASYVNASYKAGYGWGKLDASVYWENIWHKMDSGVDKLAIPAVQTGMKYMPMETRGVNLGYALKTDIRLSDENTLRLGNEYHRFTLNDWWPPVAGSMSMSPNTFVNINDGRRDRFSLYAELESKLSQKVTTVLGVRGELVQTDAGNVQGYNNSNMAGMGMMSMTTNYLRDATAFNAQDHARTDDNLDVTALLKYEPSAVATYEFGYARKTHSPSLYERYAWSTFFMCAGMVNWVGDGNAYVGNLNIRPEVANTLSITGNWHDKDRKQWELKVTPYYTYVNDYIDVNVLKLSATGNTLQFANHDARLYGLNVSGNVGLWENDGFGRGKLNATLGYVNGRNLDTGNTLYHMMPLNSKLSLEQKIAGWTNAVEFELVDGKTEVDPVRKEPTTFGYALVNLRTAYKWKNLQVDLGIMNLFDRFYYLPLGGINYDDNLANKRLIPFQALAGQGRSFTIGLLQTF